MAAANESGIDEEGVLSEEIGVLESIYITELTVIKDADGWPGKISVLLHPATGDDDSKKYVCMTLVFTIPHTYPNDIPEINVQHPRGLGEEELHSLIEDMKVLAEEMKGGAMLFELIEMAKDCLTEGNLPHCECAICLDHFEEGDAFIKTDCYHYFHRPCLARYAAAFVAKMQEEEEQAVSHTAEKEEQSRALACPMCRLPLSLDLGELLAEPVPPEELVQFTPTDELLQQQAAMAERYEQQKAKGGIIDLEEEKNKFLVSEDTVVSLENVRKPPQDPSDGKADVSNVTTHKTKNRKPLSVHAHRDGPGLAGAGRGAHLDNIIKAYSSPQRNRDNVAYKNDRRQNSRYSYNRDGGRGNENYERGPWREHHDKKDWRDRNYKKAEKKNKPEASNFQKNRADGDASARSDESEGQPPAKVNSLGDQSSSTEHLEGKADSPSEGQIVRKPADHDEGNAAPEMEDKHHVNHRKVHTDKEKGKQDFSVHPRHAGDRPHTVGHPHDAGKAHGPVHSRVDTGRSHSAGHTRNAVASHAHPHPHPRPRPRTSPHPQHDTGRHPAGRHRCGDDEIHSEVGPRHKTGNPRSTAHPGLVQGRTHPARHKKVHEDDGSHSSEEEDEKSFEKDADDFADNWQMEIQKPERPKLQGLNSRDSGSQEDGSSKKPCPHKHPHKASNAPLGDGYSHARHLGTHNKKAGESARPKLQRHDNKDLDTQGAEHHPHKTHTRPHQPVRHLGQAKKESYNHKKDDATVVQRADSKQSDTTEEDHQIKKLDHPKPAPFLRKVSVTKPGAQDTHKEIHSSKDDAVPAGEKNRYSHTAYDDSHHAGNKHNWAHDWSKHVREEKRWHGQHADSKRGGHQRHAQRSHAQDHDVLHKEEDWDKEIKKAKEENKKSDSGRKSNHPDIQSKSDGNELHKVAKGYAGKHVKEDEEAEARIARRALSDVVDLGEPHRHPRPSRPQRVMQQDMHSEQRSDHGPTHVATHMRSKKAEAREEDDWEKEASLAREKLAGSSNPTEGGKDGDTTHHIKNKHKGDTGHFHTKAHGTRKKLAAHKADKGREDLEAEAVERTQTSQNPPEKDKDSLHHEKEVNSAVAGSGEIPSQHIPGSGHKPAVLSANKPRHRGKERCPPGFRIGPPPGFDTNTKAVMSGTAPGPPPGFT